MGYAHSIDYICCDIFYSFRYFLSQFCHNTLAPEGKVPHVIALKRLSVPAEYPTPDPLIKSLLWPFS